MIWSVSIGLLRDFRKIIDKLEMNELNEMSNFQYTETLIIKTLLFRMTNLNTVKIN